MKEYAVVETILNGSRSLEVMDKGAGNYYGYIVLFESDNQEDCQKFIESHSIAPSATTVVVAPGEQEIVWERDPETGLWQNMTAHCWAINYGSPDDEEWRNDYEMQLEVEYKRGVGYCVEIS